MPIKCSTFLKLESSLPCSQEVSTGPYSGQDKFSSRLATVFPQNLLNVILPFTPSSSKNLFTLGFTNTIFYVFLIIHMSATFPTHLILLDSISLIKSGEEYRLPSSSFCSFLQSPVTPFFLDPNILITLL